MQRDIDDVSQRQAVSIDGILDRVYVIEGFDDALGKEEAAGQFVIVAGCAHNHGKAAPVETNLQRFLNGHLLFALLLFIILPMCDRQLHHALWIERRTPEARGGHLASSSLLMSRERLPSDGTRS